LCDTAAERLGVVQDLRSTRPAPASNYQPRQQRLTSAVSAFLDVTKATGHRQQLLPVTSLRRHTTATIATRTLTGVVGADNVTLRAARRPSPQRLARADCHGPGLILSGSTQEAISCFNQRPASAHHGTAAGQ